MYLLFGLVSCTWPLCDDVFLSLGVGSEGEGYARKGCTLVRTMSAIAQSMAPRRDGTHEIDADDELCLGATVTWCLSHARAIIRLWGTMATRWGTSISRLLAVAASWRTLRRVARRASLRWVAHGLLLRRIASCGGVDGWERAGGTAVLLLAGRT